MLSKKLYMHKPVYLKGGKLIIPKNHPKEDLNDYIPSTYYEKPKFVMGNVNVVSKNHSNLPPVQNSENHADIYDIVNFEKKLKGRPKNKKDDSVVFEVK